MSSIIHGYIHCFSFETEAEEYNLNILSQLEKTDSYLVRPMFNLIPNMKEHCYYGHLINFAAYYKNIWCTDNDWISDYESFISKLFWDSSEVIQVYTGERIMWRSTGTHESNKIEGLEIKESKKYSSYHETND